MYTHLNLATFINEDNAKWQMYMYIKFKINNENRYNKLSKLKLINVKNKAI